MGNLIARMFLPCSFRKRFLIPRYRLFELPWFEHHKGKAANIETLIFAWDVDSLLWDGGGEEKIRFKVPKSGSRASTICFFVVRGQAGRQRFFMSETNEKMEKDHLVVTLLNVIQYGDIGGRENPKA